MPLLRELIRFLRGRSLAEIIAILHSRNVHPLVQFLKYAVCGVVALVVHTAVYFALAAFVLPALETNTADDATRADHALINTAIAFIFSNTTAWWLNQRWVFTPGRHSALHEFLYFTLVNAPGAIGGVAAQDWLIRTAGWPAWAAFAGFVLPNVMINFLCRKFLIFHR